MKEFRVAQSAFSAAARSLSAARISGDKFIVCYKR